MGGGFGCIMRDYIEERNPSRKGVGTIELEQKGKRVSTCTKIGENNI